MPDDEIVQDFVIETSESLDQVELDLVALEREPETDELLSRIFRALHTLKGTSSFLAFARLESVSHAAEDLLGKLREGALELEERHVTALLEVFDVVRSLLAVIDETGSEDDRDIGGLVELLTGMAAAGTTAGATAAPSTSLDVSDDTTGDGLVAMEPPLPVEPLPAVAPLVDQLPLPYSREGRSTLADKSVRVDVDLLDALVRQVGELVLARNQVVAHRAIPQDRAYLRTVQQLSVVVRELHEEAMKTRLQSVEHLWTAVPRVIRDLERQFGKVVDYHFDGGDTEFDRTLMEGVKDPLLHLVRNAVDHGIELPDRRRAAGKSEAGYLLLSARHDGSQVILEVTDDGAGISVHTVAARAIQTGIATAEALSRMSPRETLDLIFAPGFSTAATVTNVSGRGVGMDVVRSKVEQLGGSVSVSTTPGKGTTIRIKIPLTLAVANALMVVAGAERYAVPQLSVQELVRLEGDSVRTGIERIHDTLVYRLRRRLIPLVALTDIFGLPTMPIGERDEVEIVVLRADQARFGVIVDEVLGMQEIVIKSLGRHLKQVPLFAGATILGDGSVALILDVPGIAGEAGVTEGRVRTFGARQDDLDDLVEEPADLQRLLIVRIGDRRLAIPLEVVDHLEELDPSAIERAGGREVTQNRGRLLPLVRLSDGRPTQGSPQLDQKLRLVVCTDGEDQVGLVCDEIIEMIEEDIHVQAAIGTGLAGSAVVQGRATDIVDVAALLESAMVPTVNS
jgi:two-component system chemotaxis sensor kinase CheA